MDYSSQFGLSLTGGDKNDELDDQITTINIELNSVILSLSDESKSRSDEDDLLDGRIIAESKSRSDEDELLDGRIIAESKSRSDEDDLLDGRIIAESKSRSDEDDLLDGRIIAEAKSRSDEDDLLDARIIAEAKSRSDEDILINGRITTERAERIFSDLAIDFRLDNIEAEIDAIDELITGGQHIIDINDDIAELKANTSNSYIRYTEGDDNLLIGTIDSSGIETNQIRYNSDVGAFTLIQPNSSIVLPDTTNTTSRWQITTTAGKTIFNYIASSGIVDTIFTINANGNIEADNLIINQGNLNNILANNSSTISGLQSAVSVLQQLQADLQDELNSFDGEDDNGNPILGIVGTVFGVGNSLSIGAIAVVVATTKTQVTALTLAVAALQAESVVQTVEDLSEFTTETRSLFNQFKDRINSLFTSGQNGYSRITGNGLEVNNLRFFPDCDIDNVANINFKETLGGTIQHLTTINDVLLLDASGNEIPLNLGIACDTTFGNELFYKTETLDNRFVNQTDYATNNTAITNNSQQLAENITAIATNITVIDANNIATNASIDANLISVNASIDANLISVNASIDANLISVNASIDANDVATIALIDAIDIRVSTNTTNLASKATTAYVDTAVANIVNGSPALLDTLSELATALDNRPNFANEVLALIGTNTTNLNDAIFSIGANNNLRIDGDALKLDKTGGSITGNLAVNGTITVGGGGENKDLLYFDTTRDWKFKTIGIGASNELVLQSMNSKIFRIRDHTDTDRFMFNTQTGHATITGELTTSQLVITSNFVNSTTNTVRLKPLFNTKDSWFQFQNSTTTDSTNNIFDFAIEDTFNRISTRNNRNLVLRSGNGSIIAESSLTVTNPAEINYKNQTLDTRFVSQTAYNTNNTEMLDGFGQLAGLIVSVSDASIARDNLKLNLTGGTISGNLSATSFNTNNNTNGFNTNSDENGNSHIGPQYTRNYLTNSLGTEFRTFTNGVYNTTATIFSDGIDFFKNVTMSITNTFNLIPAGTIIMSVRNSTTLSGYLYCNGAQYVSTIYPNLFSVIGTTYGGAQTGQPGTFVFNVPNFQGAFLRGQGSQSFNGVTYSGSGTQAQADQVLTPNTPTVTNRGYFNCRGGADRSVISRAIIPSLAADSNTGIVVNVSFPRQGTENRPFNYSVKYFIRH